MQVVSTFGAASGKAGGVVASRGRAGTQLRAHTMRTQPRSPSQLLARALTAAAASSWRALPPATHEAWATLARSSPRAPRFGAHHTLSGYALYVSCIRNLATLSLQAPAAPPPTPPSIPPIAAFTAQAIYFADTLPAQLAGFALAWQTIQTQPFAAVLRATPALSPTRHNIRPSEFRILATFNPCPSQALDVYTSWLLLYGQAPPAGAITFQLNLVDPLSGLAGPPARATAPYTADPLNPYRPGSITVSFDGKPTAVLANTVIEFSGNPIAGA